MGRESDGSSRGRLVYRRELTGHPRMKPRPKFPRAYHLSVRLSHSEMLSLKSAAEVQQLTVGGLVRKLIGKHIAPGKAPRKGD